MNEQQYSKSARRACGSDRTRFNSFRTYDTPDGKPYGVFGENTGNARLCMHDGRHNSKKPRQMD